MGQLSVDQIVQRALDFGLLDERQLQEVWSSFGSQNISPNELLQTLVRREVLTNYQVERLIRGDRSGFFYGDYKAQYLVGSGLFARVYRAVHRKTGRVVALKVLRRHYAANPVQANQFIREGRVGCTLRHPHIVAVYDVIPSGDTHVMVMEFVEGRNLREFVRVRKKIDPAESTLLMTGITDGMRYAFEHGVTHRDLKMSNILISSRGEAKLVDFGLAAMDETLTDDALADLPNSRAIEYAALERSTGVRKDDTRSDIYFLGCIYYNMLVGKPPLLETRDRLVRLSKQRFLDIVPIQKADAKIPPVVAAVVHKAMMFDPDRRYQSPSAMLADLRAAAAHLAAGTGDQIDDLSASRQVIELDAAESQQPAEPSRSLMVVESDSQMQSIFRDGFKRDGFRVLMTGDPDRAVVRLLEDPAAVDGIVVNAQVIGEPALRMFNKLAADPRTKRIPAVLLLEEHQISWSERSLTSAHRIVVSLPITMKQLRSALNRLLLSAASK